MSKYNFQNFDPLLADNVIGAKTKNATAVFKH
jgi:hypothetical protein